MFYVTQTKGLANLPEMQDGDKILVFYKMTDTIKMSCVPVLLKYPLQLEVIEDRDDMLVFLGGWFVSHDDDVTILDSTIPIPKRYADRIHKMKTRVVKTTKRTTRSKKEEKEEKEETLDSLGNENNVIKDESVDELVVSEQTVSVENKVSDANMVAENVLEDGPIQNVCAKELFDLIQMTSKDVSFNFPTEIFMMTLMSDVVESKHNAVDLKQRIIYRKQGDIIWSKMEPCLDQIWKIADRFENE